MTYFDLGHVVGSKGEKGDQGEKGEKGDKGDKGDPGTITLDPTLSTTSTNAVQNKAIATAINNKANSTHTHTKSEVTDFPSNVSSFTNDAGYLTSHQDISGKVNTSDIANNLTTTTSGKVLDARQGKILADLIGDAITYINL